MSSYTVYTGLTLSSCSSTIEIFNCSQIFFIFFMSHGQTAAKYHLALYNIIILTDLYYHHHHLCHNKPVGISFCVAVYYS